MPGKNGCKSANLILGRNFTKKHFLTYRVNKFGAIAEYEKNMIALKLRAARERKRAKEGKCEGGKSYSEAPPEVIREVKRLRQRRKGQKLMSFPMVARELNRRQVKRCHSNGGEKERHNED